MKSLRVWVLWIAVAAWATSGWGALNRSDVVFMYASSAEAYRAYGATFVAWGGANTEEQVRRHHDLGLKCTGTMWCLTAGARLLHERPELRAACAVDIEGLPIEVPWLFDQTHEGTKSYFGCANHPEFRQLCAERVAACMAGGADGLHVDDHLGVARSAWHYGGGLCDYCMAAFRAYLGVHATEAELRGAGVADLSTFDYRDLIRRHATTREAYRSVQRRIPLMDHFLQFHVTAAAEHVKRLGEIARETVGKPVLLSANAGLPGEIHTHVVEHLTHIVCEVHHHAPAGTEGIERAIEAYAMAGRMGRPMAATAGGSDWAWVKERNAETLVRCWIALAYAHGQRFMVPHPERQWCFTDQIGTHWYAAPVEAFAPLYRFVRGNAELFDDFETAPGDGILIPEKTLATVRRAPSGSVAIHLLNLDYDPATDVMTPLHQAVVRVPESFLPAGAGLARVFSYDADPMEVDVRREDGGGKITLPELRLWSILVVE